MALAPKSIIDLDTIRAARGENQQRLANEATAQGLSVLQRMVRSVTDLAGGLQTTVLSDGRVLIPDGSVTVPGLAFADDLDTGLFRDGSEWGITNDGVEWIMLGSVTGSNYSAAVDINAVYSNTAIVGFGSLVNISGELTVDGGDAIPAYFLNVEPSGVTTGDGGLSGVHVATARFVEPDITEGSNPIVTAATVRIENAPTEGDSNYALLIASDNAPIGIGADGDATITYNGANLVIDPQAVGSGNLVVEANVEIVGHTSNAVLDLLTNDESQRWRLQATESSGVFIFRDATAGTNPLIIDDGTPSNTLHVDETGGVIIGGTTPVGGAGDLRVTGDLQVDGTIIGGMTGMIVMWGAAAAPSGWLLCDGSAVSRTTYSDLFAVIGTTYGAGNGSTTFNVPDLRGRFPLGKAASGTGSTLGGAGGAIDHTHGAGSYAAASHSHGDGTLTVASHTHGAGTLEADSHNHAIGGRALSLNQVQVQSGTGANPASASGGVITLGENSGSNTASVSGDTGSDSPDVTGSTGSTAPSVSGTSGTANPPFQTFNFVIKT